MCADATLIEFATFTDNINGICWKLSFFVKYDQQQRNGILQNIVIDIRISDIIWSIILKFNKYI
jgi:hypothetical protein